MEEIYQAGGKLDLVLTLTDEQAPNKSGRVYVDAFCEKQGIDLLKVRSINDEMALAAVHDYEIDWLFVIGWSQIVREAMLNVPRRGALGIHPTLLPVGRGRAAIPWTLLKGFTETGVTLFQLDAGVDTGPILAQERLAVAPDETATTLYDRVAEAHRTLIRRVWLDLVHDCVIAVPQDEKNASYWPKRTPADGRLDSSMACSDVERLVRAVTHPYPGAFWQRDQDVVRVWRGEIGEEATPPPKEAIRLSLCDGVYDALDYELEAIPDTSEHR